MTYETDYIKLVSSIIDDGQDRVCRNGATKALFSQSLAITELKTGRFPLLTQRKIHFNSVFGELAAFVRGSVFLQAFKGWGCNYWDANARAWEKNKGCEPGEMLVGQVYGAQWVNWEKTGFNQLASLMTSIRHDPHGRRHILTSYSPTAEACLPPCHLLAQFFVNLDGTLDCQVYMRSVDVILGLPSDVVLYSALLIQMAGETDLRPGTLTFCFGDTHIYKNHIELFEKTHREGDMFNQPFYELVRTDLLGFRPVYIYIDNYHYAQVLHYDFSV